MKAATQPARVLPLGRTVATRTVSEWAAASAIYSRLLVLCLIRHTRCDWGDVCDEDRATNEQALIDGDRLLSVYSTGSPDQPTLWIITEADRSVTTILFPEDY